MKIESPRFGSLTVDPDKVVEFPRGLPGFERCTRFSLFHQEGSSQPVVYTLQCLDDPAVAFSLADPAVFGFNYELTLTDEEAALLGTRPGDETALALILSRTDDGRINANVTAPLVINPRTRRGLQQVIARVGFDVTFRPQG